jgi:Domain of unknown function (DUF4234)
MSATMSADGNWNQQEVNARPLGKNRNPFAVWFLSAITLGIYFLYWHYKVNAEIRDHEPLVKSSPGASLAALLLSPLTLFISILVTCYNTAVRIQRMEMADGQPQQISPTLTFLLLCFFGVGYYFQIQGHLNAHWEWHRLRSSRRELAGGAALPGLPSTTMPPPPVAQDVAEPATRH